MANDGPAPVEQAPPPTESLIGKVKGFFKQKPQSPPPHPLPAKDVTEKIREVRTELGKVTGPQTPEPKPQVEEPPVVPGIKNSYGTRSQFQATLDGKQDGQWQYAVRDTHTVDASYPQGHLLRIPGTATEENFMGDVRHFDSADEALDFALAKNREGTSEGWDDVDGHHESTTIHYDPREQPPEETKNT